MRRSEKYFFWLHPNVWLKWAVGLTAHDPPTTNTGMTTILTLFTLVWIVYTREKFKKKKGGWYSLDAYVCTCNTIFEQTETALREENTHMQTSIDSTSPPPARNLSFFKTFSKIFKK